MIYQDALDWVNQLSIGGSDDWHLPSQADMEHLHNVELGNLLYSDQTGSRVMRTQPPSSTSAVIITGHHSQAL